MHGAAPGAFSNSKKTAEKTDKPTVGNLVDAASAPVL